MPGGVGVSSSFDMATQIDALADNTAAWEALADSGRQAAQRTYHPDLTTGQLLAALGELGCQAVQ